jgi:hypothetical protein
VAWKEPIHRRVLGAKDMRGVVIVSGVAYGVLRQKAAAVIARSCWLGT